MLADLPKLVPGFGQVLTVLEAATTFAKRGDQATQNAIHLVVAVPS